MSMKIDAADGKEEREDGEQRSSQIARTSPTPLVSGTTAPMRIVNSGCQDVKVSCRFISLVSFRD